MSRRQSGEGTLPTGILCRTRRLLRELLHGNTRSPQEDGPGLSPGTAFIHMLPTELTLDILEHIYNDIFSQTDNDKLRDWLCLLHTCRRWRALLCSNPRFWRKVPLGPKRKLTLYFLNKIKNGHPEIYIDSISTLPSVRVLQRWLPYIRLLSISVTHANQLNVFRSFFQSPGLPFVQEIHLLLGNHSSGMSLKVALPRQLMPNLRSLKLRGLLVTFEHVDGLRRLDLDHCLWGFTFRSIYHIAPMWVRLWELRLKHSLNCLPGPGQQLIGESAVQSRVLLILRTLQVEDHNVENIAALIYGLELPFARTVDILYKVPSPAPADDAHYSFRSIFGGLVERNVLAVPTGMLFGILFLLYPGTASVTVQNNEYAVRYEDEAHSVTLRIATAFDRDWSRALPSALQDLIEFFPRVRISTLVVRGDPYHVSIALWEDIFVKCCRDLETLRLTGNGSWLAAWRALSGRHTLPIEADDQQAHERARALGRLRIKKVYIQHVSRPDDNFPAPPDERVLEEIRAVLSHLSKSGRKLQELRWEVQRSRHSDFDDARRRFMEALSPYVDRLSYGDSESWNDPARLPVIGHGTKVPPSRLDATMLHEELMELRRLLRA